MPWRNALIGPGDNILEAIERIDNTKLRIALVVDDSMRLIGTVTDGDIRRGLLQNISVDSSVTKVMNASPRTASLEEPWEAVCERFGSQLLHQIPIVDRDGTLLDVRFLNDTATEPGVYDNWVVLMAGGEGRRLRPLTEKTPKPMIKVGKQPIIETILASFKKQGFSRFYISVNYQADILRSHLGDGDGLGIEIRYLEEEKPLGTAGALSLIAQKHSKPLIVMNADLLTKLDFAHLLDYHSFLKSDATMCVTEYDFQVPFGVAQLGEQNQVLKIDEKPVYAFFVNAGIYVINPALLETLKRGEPFDMPHLLEQVVNNGGKVDAFPIREYWLDVGNLDSLELAKAQFDDVFGAFPAS